MPLCHFNKAQNLVYEVLGATKDSIFICETLWMNGISIIVLALKPCPGGGGGEEEETVKGIVKGFC